MLSHLTFAVLAQVGSFQHSQIKAPARQTINIVYLAVFKWFGLRRKP